MTESHLLYITYKHIIYPFPSDFCCASEYLLQFYQAAAHQVESWIWACPCFAFFGTIEVNSSRSVPDTSIAGTQQSLLYVTQHATLHQLQTKPLQVLTYRSCKWSQKGFARPNTIFQDPILNHCQEKMTSVLLHMAWKKSLPVSKWT